MDLSIIILTMNERDNLVHLIPELHKCVDSLKVSYEILILDGNSSDGTPEVAKDLGCRVVMQTKNGYGNALRQAFQEAKGNYLITIDADYSHDPEFIHHLWAKRASADMIIASRYAEGGKAEMPLTRLILSKILNKVYGSILSLPYRDISSGFRIYCRNALDEALEKLSSVDFDILEEILIRLHCDGRQILEIPFLYRSRLHGKSNAKIVSFGLSYLKTLRKMWLLRNSPYSCDYDSRAYQSLIPLQRYWNRKRYRIISDFIKDHRKILDIGCGSSKIIQSLPAAVALDINLRKLRYLKSSNPLLIRGDLNYLPFKDNIFSTIICSEVIEHIPKTEKIFLELVRVLKEDGELIIGTPDYSTLTWRFIEWWYYKIFPLGYVEQHISHYTRVELDDLFKKFGFKIIDYKYIGGAELIYQVKKLAGTKSSE